MSNPPFRIVSLGAEHNKDTRARFCSGSEPLDTYLKKRVTQDMRRGIASCFIAVDDQSRIAGYYTLASASVPLLDLPETYKKKLPRYPSVPVVRLGRLAVDSRFQVKGLGAALLVDALIRISRLQSELGVYALVVDAKDDTAADFYIHHGFIPTSSKNTLFLPLAVASKLLDIPPSSSG